MDRYDKATYLAQEADEMQALIHDDQIEKATFKLLLIHSIATELVDEIVEESLE